MSELGERTDGALSAAVVGKIESGRKSEMSVEHLILLARALQVPPSALMFDVEKPNSQSGVDQLDTPADLTVWQAMGWMGGRAYYLMTNERPPSAERVMEVVSEYETYERLADEHATIAWSLGEAHRQYSGDPENPASGELLQMQLHRLDRARRALEESIARMQEMGVDLDGQRSLVRNSIRPAVQGGVAEA